MAPTLTRILPPADTYHSTELAITDTAQLSKIVGELGWSSVKAVVHRGTRFTSSSYSAHHSVNSLSIPPEEKHIYASIEVLKNEIDGLRKEKSSLQQRGDEQDNEILALRNQLAALDRRPDSGFGAPEVDLEELREQKLKYEATMRTFNALQDRNTAKRRTLEEALKKATEERTDYMQQLAAALSEIEELKKSKTYLLEQNTELRTRIDAHVCKTSNDEADSIRKKLSERITSYEYVVPSEEHQSAAGDRVTSRYSLNLDGLPSDFTENLEYYIKGDGLKNGRPEGPDPMTQSRPSHSVSSAGHWPSASMDDDSDILPENSPAVLPHSMKAKVGGRFVRFSKYGYNTNEDEIHSHKKRGSDKSESANDAQNEHLRKYGSRTISSADWSDLDLRHNSAPRPPKHLRKWENWPKGIMDQLDPRFSKLLATQEEHESNTKDTNRKESATTENAEGWTSFSDGRSMSNGMDKVIANSFIKSRQQAQQQNDSQNLTGLSQAMRDISNSEIVRSRLEEERKASREPSDAPSKTPLLDFQKRKASLKKVTIVSPHSSDEAEPHMASGSFHSAPENKAATDKSSGTEFHSFSGQKSLRDYQNMAGQEDSNAWDKPPLASSMCSKRRYERNSSAKDGETSAFIVPDITLNKEEMSGPYYRAGEGKVTGWLNKQSNKEYVEEEEHSIPPPIPVTERSAMENDEENADLDIPDLDISHATIRPSQPPPQALAMVIKQIEDEVAHLKHKLASYQVAYARHEPSVGKRRRVALKQSMEQYEAEIEKRSEQVYALYDVLEGQKCQKF